MENAKVDAFMINAGKYFTSESLPVIRQKLIDGGDDKLLMVSGTEFKSPMAAFWLNFFLGNLGVDYFYLGKSGLGVAKLLTCGGIGIWTLINLFTIIGTTKKCNVEKILPYL